jgi:SH3-like domain-containing protein
MVLRSFVRAATALVLLVASASGAAAWCVRGVKGWDTLRMRAAPTPFAREIGRIPPAACGVAIIGPCRGAWCPLRWQNRVGWSNAFYLARGGLFDFLTPPLITRPPPGIAAPPPPTRAARAPAAQRTGARKTAQARPAGQKSAPRVRTSQRRSPPARIAAVPPRAQPVKPEAPLSPAPPAAAAAQPSPPAAPAQSVAPAIVPARPALVPPAASAPAQKAAPQGDGTSEVCIVDVPKGDTLKVRAAPGNDQTLRYGYPAGVCGVQITGPCANGWCPVDYRGYRGWAEQRFLK